jgi:8-oxo-dGTP diphosphatase
MGITPDRINEIAEPLRRPGLSFIVDAFVLHPKELKILMQKRAPDRRLFPNFWDPVGGHLKANESIFEGLVREAQEEIGASLSQVYQLVHSFDWKDGERSMRNLQFLAEVSGSDFVLQRPKVVALKWFDFEDLRREAPSMTAQMRDGLSKALQAAELLRR